MMKMIHCPKPKRELIILCLSFFAGFLICPPILAREWNDGMDDNIRKYPAISFDQINRSIDKSLETYGSRIREIQGRINQPRQELPTRVQPPETQFYERYPSIRKSSLKELRERRDSQFQRMPATPSPYYEPMSRRIPPVTVSSYGQLAVPAELEETQPIDDQNAETKFSPVSRARAGVYLLPFVGMQIPEVFDWTPSIDLGLQQKIGWGGGLRLGRKWERFFLEADFGHYRNKFDGFEGEVLFGSNPFESGSVSGMAGFFNLGANIPMGDQYGFCLGGGVGYGVQKIEVDLGSLGVSEKEEILSYQLLAEFYQQVTERFLWGLRYRWIQIDEMGSFSERRLHSFEVSAGFHF